MRSRNERHRGGLCQQQVRTGAGDKVNLLDNVRELQDAGAAAITVCLFVLGISRLEKSRFLGMSLLLLITLHT